METKFCQSCGMPLQKNEELGTNHDGSKNEEYCCYCYKDGAFTMDCTMDQMIDHCVQFVDEFNKDADLHYTKEEAVANMKLFFPTLKRWAVQYYKKRLSALRPAGLISLECGASSRKSPFLFEWCFS